MDLSTADYSCVQSLPLSLKKNLMWSSTDKSFQCKSNWGQIPTPCFISSLFQSRLQFYKKIEPRVGLTSPASMLKKVLLPAPLGPMSAKISCLLTAREWRSRATKSESDWEGQTLSKLQQTRSWSAEKLLRVGLSYELYRPIHNIFTVMRTSVRFWKASTPNALRDSESRLRRELRGLSQKLLTTTLQNSRWKLMKGNIIAPVPISSGNAYTIEFKAIPRKVLQKVTIQPTSKASLELYSQRDTTNPSSTSWASKKRVIPKKVLIEQLDTQLRLRSAFMSMKVELREIKIIAPSQMTYEMKQLPKVIPLTVAIYKTRSSLSKTRVERSEGKGNAKVSPRRKTLSTSTILKEAENSLFQRLGMQEIALMSMKSFCESIDFTRRSYSQISPQDTLKQGNIPLFFSPKLNLVSPFERWYSGIRLSFTIILKLQGPVIWISPSGSFYSPATGFPGMNWL